MSLARSMIAVRGYTAEVERSIRDALERSDAAGDAPQRFPVLRSLATLHVMRADFRSGVELGRELLAIAEATGRRGAAGRCAPRRRGEAATCSGPGRVPRAPRPVDRALRGAVLPPVQFRVGPSPGVVANVVSGLLLWSSGFPDRARLRVDRAWSLPRRCSTRTRGPTGSFTLRCCTLAAGPGARGRPGRRTAAGRQRNDYPIWRALALVLRGTARIGAGEVTDGPRRRRARASPSTPGLRHPRSSGPSC